MSTTQLTRVRLYGDLGEKFGREHRFAITSPAEALRALRANYPTFESAIRADGRYCVLAGKRSLGADEIALPTGRAEVRIVPLVSGAGAGARIVLGGVLIALASYFTAGGAAAIAAAGTAGAAAAGVASAVGWGLVLGGVSSILFTHKSLDPKSNERPENKPSYAFNGPVNTTAQGNPVPVGYGRLRVGSQVISAGLYVEEFAG